MKIDSSLPPTAAPELPKGPQAAEAFEAYLIGYLAKEMRESVPNGPLNSGASGMFGDFFDQEIGKRVAAAGGIGMRAELEAALARHEGGAAAPASPVAARPLRPDPHEASATDAHLNVTSGFGSRRDPFDGTVRAHHGIDLGLRAGTPVHAERDGVVTFAGQQHGYGNVVIIDHGNGVETRYAHCASLAVTTGDTVTEGAVLGTVGSTGRSTGPHLHFELRENGRPTDPESFIKENR